MQSGSTSFKILTSSITRRWRYLILFGSFNLYFSTTNVSCRSVCNTTPGSLALSSFQTLPLCGLLRGRCPLTLRPLANVSLASSPSGWSLITPPAGSRQALSALGSWPAKAGFRSWNGVSTGRIFSHWPFVALGAWGQNLLK